jgi:hypothetical protein
MILKRKESVFPDALGLGGMAYESGTHISL